MSAKDVKYLLYKPNYHFDNHLYKYDTLFISYEYMMQQYFETGCDGYCERLWYNNGGYFTHNAFKHCRKEYRKEILDYIASLPINIDIVVNGQQILLVHGAPLEAQHLCIREYESPEAFSVWHRQRPHDVLYMDKLVIYGHTGFLL